MKIALTADVHLTNQDSHPERFNALENIFSQALGPNTHSSGPGIRGAL